MKRREAPRADPGRVRIIGGRLRGSRLDVAELPGLRPTSDRVRETLFNWLAPRLAGARCLDAFAGSGALGLEAVSRGAASVLMLERDPRAAAALSAAVQRLRVEVARVRCTDALSWLKASPGEAFDLVFLDPPFGAGLLDAALAALGPHLAPGACVYVECARESEPVIPAGWTLLRQGETREVRYALWHSDADTPATLSAGSEPPERQP